MKSIKSTFVRTLSLLLALIMVFSIPISAFATTEETEDYGVSTAAYTYDDTRAKMIAHSAYQALKYLGYDKDGYLENKGYLFAEGYIAGSLKKKIDDDSSEVPNCLTDVPYKSNEYVSGMQTSTSNTGHLNVTSATGKYPHVRYFEQLNDGYDSAHPGLDCSDFVAYYLTNYIPNIEGNPCTVITDAMEYLEDNGINYGGRYDDSRFWDKARDYFKSHKVKVWEVNEVDYDSGKISKYTDPLGNVCTDDIYTSGKLKPGTLIQMGNKDSKTVHYAIYLGTYDGQHIIVHSGSSKRGPEVSVVEKMADESNGDKRSVPLYFYEFPHVNKYGSVTVEKDGPNGEKLAGATFLLINKDTGDSIKLITGSDGTAFIDELPLGPYSIQETVPPDGYVLDSTVYTFELTSSASHYVHSATNQQAKGSIVAVKYKADGTTWLPGAVFGCKTAGKDEYVYVYDADSGSVTFTDPTSNKTVTAYADGKANGVATFSNLPLGTYRVYEAKPPEGYVRTTLVETVVLETNGQVERVYKPTDGSYTDAFLNANGDPYDLFTNKLAIGSIQVVKYEEGSDAWVPGAVFGILTPSGERIYVYDADSGSVTFTDPYSKASVTVTADGGGNGVATFSNLPLGTYRVYEAMPPANYIRSTLIETVVLSTDGQRERLYKPADGTYTGDYQDENGDPYDLFYNTPVASVRVHKYNKDAAGYVPGAVFALRNTVTGNVYYRYDADSGSVAFVDPVTGETVTVSADGSGNGSVTFTGLPLGTYELYEAKAPADHLRDETIVTVELTTPGQFERVHKPTNGSYTEDYLDASGEPYHLFRNTALGRIQITKYNADASGTVSGAVFAVRNTATGEVKYLYDAASGTTIFRDPVANKSVSVSADRRADGTVLFTNLPEGTYEVYEAKAPTGYVRDTTIVTVVLSAAGQIERLQKPSGDYTEEYLDENGLPYHLFCNALATGGIVVQKRDDSTMALVPGAVFGCYNTATGAVYYQYDAEADASVTFIDPKSGEEVTCSGDGAADGSVTFGDLPYGTYEVLELVPPEGYDLGEIGGITVTLSSSYPSHVSEYDFLNKAHRGSAEIVKETTNGGTKAGWLFEFYLIDGSEATLLGTYPTDAEGKILLEELMPGQYLAQEIGHETMSEEELSYWTLHTQPQYVDVTANETASVIFTNQWLGKLSGQKTSVNSDILEGWIIRIEKPDGTVIDTVTTDAEGKFTLDIAPGEYVLREIGHETIEDLSDWVLDTAQTVTVTAGATAEVSFTNTYGGYGQISKETTNSGTKEGWLFEVRDSAGDLIDGSPFESDANGDIDLGLLAPGTYTVSEIGRENDTGDYWIMDTEAKTLEVIAGQTASVTFTNRWMGKLSIQKEMADGSSPEGWEFVIRDGEGNEIDGSPFFTDADGRIFTGLLEPGIYTVEEIIPEGSLYQCEGENPRTIEVTAGQTVSVTFTNTLNPGSLTVHKVDGATGEPLAGAVFLLEWLDGDTWTPVTYSDTITPGGCGNAELVDGCLTSGEDGIITFEGLHPDCEYRLTEVKAPEGYLLKADHVFVGKLPAGDFAVSLTVENDPVYVYPPSGSIGAPGLHGFALACAAATLLMMIGLYFWLPRSRNHVINVTDVDNNFTKRRNK